jgi:hypothetical protein
MYSQQEEEKHILEVFKWTKLSRRHMPISTTYPPKCQWCDKHSDKWEVGELCAGTEGGRFLDIGAFNATTFSNTRALYELGWSGILVEPSPGPLHGLVKAYGNDSRIKIIGGAITVQGGLLELEITDDAVTMAADAPQLEQWRSAGGFFGKLTVPSISMQQFFDQFGGAFDFVNIDTEGTSFDLFVSMLGIGPRPRCVCLEHDNRLVEIAQYAESANYRQVHLNGTNVIYEWQGGR